ncbi:MAG: MBL fold metallo-hydrolase [Luteimonas sp.]
MSSRHPIARPRRRRLRRAAVLSALVLGVLAVSACTLSFVRTSQPVADYASSPQAGEGRFTNPSPRPPMGFAKGMKLWWDILFNKPGGTTPPLPTPVLPLTADALAAAPDRSLWRLGHSTVLLKLRGGFWITDPVFAERASPVSFAGPRRWHAPPIALDALPPLRGVVLSHDHYDHLDHATVRALADRAQVFLAPLGVGDRLVAWGVPRAKVQQFDWWQGVEIDGLRFTATPAQHFSGRGLLDGDKTLWASWVIEDPASADDGGLKLFFSGDTGYFDGFAEIGRRFGPFDVALVETGAYDRRWAFVHMLPEETVQAHLDLGARVLLPIHNGTFDLAMHAWDDPFERVSAIAAARGVALATPRMGERLDAASPAATQAWWREMRRE